MHETFRTSIKLPAIEHFLEYKNLSIIETWWRSIMKVDSGILVVCLHAEAQKILPWNTTMRIRIEKNYNLSNLQTQIFGWMLGPKNKNVHKFICIYLSTMPIIAFSAGTKLPMCERKTIRATYKSRHQIMQMINEKVS